MGWLDNVPLNLLNKDLDGLWARQQAISDNIANVETPGFKSSSVSFEDQLREVLADTSAGTKERAERIRNAQVVTARNDDKIVRADGNNVDIEKENVELARTQLNYMYSLQEMSNYFARLRYAITGGKA